MRVLTEAQYDKILEFTIGQMVYMQNNLDAERRQGAAGPVNLIALVSEVRSMLEGLRKHTDLELKPKDVLPD